MRHLRFLQAFRIAIAAAVMTLTPAVPAQMPAVPAQMPAVPAQMPATTPVPDPGPQTPHLRAMTYNIHHGAGNEECPPPAAGQAAAGADCSLNLERIAKVIREADADIVGLQEIERYWRRSGGVDQPRVLARQLGMFVCFGANLRLPAESGIRVPREYGTALLSRFPLRNCANASLPRVSEMNEQRGVLSAEVQTPGGAIRVLVTHLSVVLADRPQQMEAIARALPASALPTILMGDFNTQPQEDSLLPLFAQMSDAWVQTAPPREGASPGFTFPCHPKDPPGRRIDYILLSPGMRIASMEVLTSETTRMASDHCPVLVRIAQDTLPPAGSRR